MIKTQTEESTKNDWLGNRHEEFQYIRLISEINTYGSMEEGRNGKAKTIFGSAMHFDLSGNTIPLLTTKKVAFKTCLKELLWFINGNTNNKILKEQKVGIWNQNASREFLDSRGLLNNEVDDLGPVYGHQWRHFNAKYNNCNTDYTGKGVDQLQNIIDQLKNPTTRNSRRLIMSAWNPEQLDEMALPPCHILCQFCVTENNKLSCSLYQRSGDVGLGVPFNIASYSILTHLIAKHCGLVPKEFIYFLGNAHIYDDHIEVLKKQITRKPFIFPKLNISCIKENISDYVVNDFNLIDYKYHEKIKMKMRK
jgi:thymidylate synthase